MKKTKVTVMLANGDVYQVSMNQDVWVADLPYHATYRLLTDYGVDVGVKDIVAVGVVN